MLTEPQENYMTGIPEDAQANIESWNSEAAEFAKDLVMQIEQATGLEVFWGGSLALEIPGQNDIDLTIFAEPEDFDRYVPKIALILGEPKWKLSDKILWRTAKDGYKVDAYLGSKASEGAQADLFFSNSLKNNPVLLQEYVSLKEQDLSAREYYKRKNEFYNRVIALKHTD